VLESLDRYPRRAMLQATPDQGRARVTLRLTRPEDRAAIDALVDRLPRDDLMFARTYLTQDGLAIDWITDADAFWTMAIVAERRGKIVGFAHLHADPARQSGSPAGDIQFVVAPEVRGRGLGSLLARECLWIAGHLGLTWIDARVTSGQPAARAVFERLGFVPAAMLPDGASTADGRARHVLVMRRAIEQPTSSGAGRP
jgi:RimJ/RimL family protein N-acetyltransferase